MNDEHFKREIEEEFAKITNPVEIDNLQDIERALLGHFIADEVAFYHYMPRMSEGMFNRRGHKIVFNEMLEMAEQGVAIEAITLLQSLNAKKLTAEMGGVQFFSSILGGKTDNQMDSYITILENARLRRELVGLSNSVIDMALNETDPSVIMARILADIEAIQATKVEKVRKLSDSMADVLSLMSANQVGASHLSGIYTGLSDFDRTGGLQKGNLMIIAGATSQGKSSLVSNMTYNACTNGYKCAFYSLEMTDLELTARIIAGETKIPSSSILYSKLRDAEMDIINRKADNIAAANIFFDDRSSSDIDTIVSSIRTMKLKYDIDFAVIDYLQILNVNMKGVNKEQQMGEVARKLKNLAKELDIAIIALSQLNRDKNNPEPSLERIRDSGQIAEASDIVMFVHRPETYGIQYTYPYENYDVKNTALIDVAKGRNIGIFKWIVGFDPELTSFYEIDFTATNKQIDSKTERVCVEPF